MDILTLVVATNKLTKVRDASSRWRGCKCCAEQRSYNSVSPWAALARSIAYGDRRTIVRSSSVVGVLDTSDVPSDDLIVQRLLGSV